MEITSRAEFAADPQTVFTMLLTKEYLDEVCVASESLTYECRVDGMSTHSTRNLPAPDQAKKFTGDTIKVQENVVWGEADAAGTRTGKVTLTVPGQPVSMNGTVTLSAGGAGSVVELKADLKVSIPLVGKKLEQAAAPGILQGFKVQQKVGTEWLASHSA